MLIVKCKPIKLIRDLVLDLPYIGSAATYDFPGGKLNLTGGLNEE
jgi:hypothetical protein